MVLKVAMVFLVVLMVSVVCYARPYAERLDRNEMPPPIINYPPHQRYIRGADSSSSESSSSDSSDEDNAPPLRRPVYRPPWHERYHWETPARPSPAVFRPRPTPRWSVYRPVYTSSPTPAPTTTDLPNSVADYATDVEETDSHSQSLSNGQQEINSNDVNAPIPYRIQQ